MADEPTRDNQDGANPDPENAIDGAREAADAAARDLESAEGDEESAAALDAAATAAAKVKQEADAAAAGSGGKNPRKPAADAAPFTLQTLAASLTKGKKETLDLLSDVQLNVRIELGRTRMYVEDVLQLGDGAVVELDKLAGDPVDVFVNDRHVARGEVLVLNDNFCVRISEILDPGAEAAG